MPGIDSYTKLCIVSGSSADNSTDFYDSSYSGRTITPSGNIHHDTDDYIFGTSSIKSDGDGDYLSVPASSDFRLLSGTSFCIDFRSKSTSYVGDKFSFYSEYSGTIYGYIKIQITAFYITATLYSYDITSDTEKQIELSAAISGSAWRHFALTRESGTTRLFVNGVLQDSTTNAVDSYSTHSALNIADGIAGYVDQIRFSVGDARWTANFTPPEESYDTRVPNPGEYAIPALSIEADGFTHMIGTATYLIPSTSTQGSGGNYGHIQPSMPFTSAGYGGGYGSVNLPAASAYSVASELIIGIGSYQVPRFIAVAYANTPNPGNCSILLRNVSVTGECGGSGDISSSFSFVGAGDSENVSVGSFSIPSLSYLASGLAGSVGDGDYRVSQLSVSSIGVSGTVGSGAYLLNAPSFVGVSTINGANTGNVSLTNIIINSIDHRAIDDTVLEFIRDTCTFSHGTLDDAAAFTSMKYSRTVCQP